jgi:hypothetical protein
MMQRKSASRFHIIGFLFFDSSQPTLLLQYKTNRLGKLSLFIRIERSAEFVKVKARGVCYL